MIIHIDQNTRQKKILDELAQKAGDGGVLRISVNSLPIYLSTKIAFNIFNYRLRNYPRKVLWISLDKNILELLHLSDLDVDELYYIDNSHTKLKKPEPKLLGQNQVEDSTEKIQDKKEPPTMNIAEVEIDDSVNLIELSVDNDSIEEESEDELEQPVDSIKNIQNLDSWIDRIEATKIALDSLKTEEASKVFGFADFVKSVDFSPSAILNSTKKKKPQSIKILSSVFGFAVAAILLLVSFPTNVFTLEVVPQEIESNISLSMPIDSFSKKTMKISKSASKPASGADKETTERATGRVRIVNNSFQQLEIDTNSYYFEKGPNKYFFLNDSTVSNDLVVEAQNQEKEDVTQFTIQAEEAGDSYSIGGANERLEIYNAFGQTVCGNCFALTTTPVRGQLIEGGKIVTEADQNLLRNTIEGLQAVERLKEIDLLKNENVFVDSTWYKNLDSVFIYDHQLGDAAKEVSLQVDVTTSIYYIPRTMVEDILYAEIEDVKEVKSIVLNTSSGGFIDDTGEIDLDFLYSYTKNDGLDKKEIREKLKNDDTALIQEKYPNVRRVQKKKLGVDVPFLSPRIDINIVEAK